MADLTESYVLLEKSHERLVVAQSLYDDTYYEDAVSRAHYAMFFAARALLLTQDISPKTHRGVIAAVSERFVKAGQLSHEVWEFLAAGETIREEAKYLEDMFGMPVDVVPRRAIREELRESILADATYI